MEIGNHNPLITMMLGLADPFRHQPRVKVRGGFQRLAHTTPRFLPVFCSALSDENHMAETDRDPTLWLSETRNGAILRIPSQAR